MVITTEDCYNPNAKINVQIIEQKKKNVHGKYQKERRSMA